MPIQPEESCEIVYNIQFDELGRIRVTDTDLARAIVRRALTPGGLDIVVEAAAGITPLNPIGACPVPILNGAGCPPINQCPDGMCPMKVKLHFAEEVEQEWTSLPENS